MAESMTCLLMVLHTRTSINLYVLKFILLRSTLNAFYYVSKATKHLLDKEAPGLVVAMISSSLQVTPMAMLSRYVVADALIIVTADAMYVGLCVELENLHLLLIYLVV